MSRAPRLAWLFDIDGTLLRTDGAAREAFAAAVRDVLGQQDDLAGIAFAGRIDPLILGDILARHRVARENDVEERFWIAVLGHMRAALGQGRGRLLPGVTELLEAIAGEPAWVSTLLTGNMSRMAALKLRHYGIAEKFAAGAFGEEAESRDALACLAVARIAERWGIPASRCIVVGDTVHDIACARAAGAHAVAVATGLTPREQLEARGADLVLDDLGDGSRLIRWARDVEAAN
jgi:phosphoglycolate phosphatase-like HAD superfamily hydrolase